MDVRNFRGEGYSIIFADPPYQAEEESWLFEKCPWRKLLLSDGVWVLEWSSRVAKVWQKKVEWNSILQSAGLECFRSQDYGDTAVSHFRLLQESS
jgi:16S rRNA G966 N2-methylase RsmD